MATKLFSSSSSDLSTGLADKADFNAGDIFVNILLKFIDVLEAAVIIVAGIIFIKIVKSYIRRIQTTHERQQTALNLFEKITSGFLIIVTFTLALKVVGLDLTLMISVITLGLSFGLRDVIKNYMAGLLILFKSPFEIGDVIKIRNFVGRVERIEFQATTIKTFEHREITIHNSDLLTQPITNYSKAQHARLEISVPLGYGTDTSKALRIFDTILQNDPAVLKSPKYSIVFKTFHSEGIHVLIRFWVQKPANELRIRSALVQQISSAFDEAGIMAPYGREAQLSPEFGMSEDRKKRIADFYAQPLFAQVVPETVPLEEYADADEPE